MGQWGYGMMSGLAYSGWGSLIGIFILVDLILLAVWLFKQIQRK